METFWNTIARYNEGTWMAQAVITLAGILLTVLLYRRPTQGVKRTMKAYMVFLNGWISAVYYMAYGGTRSYHYILAIFWGILALIWLWDLLTGYTTFERNRRYGRLVAVLYAMPFLYPLLSWARGMEFPMMTTTVMPCSVAVFTIGLLLGFSRKVNLLIILFLCHWALIAFSKIYVYQIPEDTRARHLPVLQELLRPEPAQGDEAQRTGHERTAHRRMRRHRRGTQPDAAERTDTLIFF